MQIARIEQEPALFNFVIPHDDWWLAGRQRVSQVPGGDARDLRIDTHLQPVEWVVGWIRFDGGLHAGPA